MFSGFEWVIGEEHPDGMLFLIYDWKCGTGTKTQLTSVVRLDSGRMFI